MGKKNKSQKKLTINLSSLSSKEKDKYDRVMQFLNAQTNQTKSIVQALLVVSNQFGNVDLPTALADYGLTQLSNNKDQSVSTAATQESKEKAATKDEKIDQPKDYIQAHHPKPKETRQEEKQLSPEEINKMLWDGNPDTL